MTPPRKILPIGIESFANMRRGNFYYVDKTEFAWQLTQEAGRYFLSRPRVTSGKIQANPSTKIPQ